MHCPLITALRCADGGVEKVDYAKLYFDTIRETLLTVDTSRPFWPSSPSNGVIEENPYVGVWGNPYDQVRPL
jgi:beta-mannosidase